MKAQFTQWFDIKNKEHLKAYKFLGEHGHWPEEFIPEDIEMEINWNIIITYKMANQYVEDKIS
jgi:hypothetical protein